MKRGNTTTMIAALFHCERYGNSCAVTCDLVKDWTMYFRSPEEFLAWFRATMVRSALDYAYGAYGADGKGDKQQ